MAAEVVSLAERRRERSLQPRDRSRVQAEVRGGLVVLLAREQDVAFTPAALRTMVRHLEALATAAEGGPMVAPEPGEAESRARLALLARELDALDRGEKRLSDVVWLLRQMTSEVRRG